MVTITGGPHDERLAAQKAEKDETISTVEKIKKLITPKVDPPKAITHTEED